VKKRGTERKAAEGVETGSITSSEASWKRTPQSQRHESVQLALEAILVEVIIMIILPRRFLFIILLPRHTQAASTAGSALVWPPRRCALLLGKQEGNPGHVGGSQQL